MRILRLKGGVYMPQFTVDLTEESAKFYQKVADRAGLPIEQVLADALFKLAGDLAMYLTKNK